MKILVATNLLQAACLLVLVVFLLDRNDDIALPAVASPATPLFSHSPPAGMVPTEQDEARLRQIIREELIVVLRDPDKYRMNDAAARRRSPEENRYQREFVSQQIDYYASVGSIDEHEMQELQREIAELDNAGRKEMLNKLTRAMNARQIKGQL